MTAAGEEAILVYDVGGSHVSAAVCSGDDFRLGPIARSLHLAGQSCDDFIQMLYSLGLEASAGSENVAGAALAMPGPFDFALGISWMQHKLPYLYGRSLRELLAAGWGWEGGRVRFLPDAAAFLLGEVAVGAANGVARVAGLTLGTGLGSAFAINGEVVTEGPGVPPGGEVWNLPYQSGILEDALSTRAIQGSYRRHRGRTCDVADIAAAAAGDPAAAAAFADFGRHLGLAIRMVMIDFAPDMVILGGGISRSAHLFLTAAQQELDGCNFQLRVSALQDRAPLVGAATLFKMPAHRVAHKEASVAD